MAHDYRLMGSCTNSGYFPFADDLTKAIVISLAHIDNGHGVRTIMKTIGKTALFVTGLCLIAVAICVALFWAHRNHIPGNFGKHLEFRLAAYNLGRFDQFSPRPEGTDVFSATQAQQFAQSGEAPSGFMWMPLSRFILRQTGGIEPHGITRVVNGRESLLVADQPGMILTHTGNTPFWGVKSVKITATYVFGPVVKTVQITFDSTARDMLRQFTQRYVHHSVAVVVDGEVVANLGLLTPMRRGVLGLTFPEGEETEAEQLRDSLMK
jgi:hypothetical protein